jgi:hypothetical protein
MARIYEARGPQIALQGPSTGSGFQAVQAFDPSRQILNQSDRQLAQAAEVGEVILRNQARDVEALSQFSNTLNKFLFEQAEKKNKKDLDLGVAEVLNGDRTVKPEAFQQFKQAETFLGDKALADASLSDSVAQVSPAVAEQARADSPAISGWRAYGQAVGRAKLAASSSQMMMSEFMESDQPIVPIPTPDGGTRMISPMAARTPAEIMAAYAVGQQIFIQQAGLSNINPVIIAEHLTPTMLGVKQGLISNKIASARKAMQQEEIEQVQEFIGANVLTLDPKDPNLVQTFWQESTKDLQINGRMSRGEANQAVVESFISHAKALGRTDLLEALANTPLIAGQPNGPRVGDRFRPLFEEAARGVEQYNDYLEGKKEKEQDSMVDDLLSAHQLLLTQPGVSSAQIQSSWANTTDQLRKLAGAGSNRAVGALSDMIQQGESYNPFLAADLARDIAAGQYPSAASIDELVRLNKIKPSEAAELKSKLPSSAAVEKTKALEPEIKRLVRGVFANSLAEQGINTTDAGSAAALMEGQMADELSELAQAYIEQNPQASPAEVRDFLRTRAGALIQQPRFTPVIKDGRVVPKAPLSNNPKVQKFLNPVTGRNTRDFSTATPAQVQSSRPVTGTDWLISSQELAQNTQNFLSGGQPTPRVKALMSATGKSWDGFLRDQSKAYGIPFTQLSQSQAAQAAQQRRSLAPAAAAILDNPNATSSQRIRAWNDITSARQRQTRQTSGKNEGPAPGSVPGGALGPEQLVDLALQSGFTPELAPVMAAIALAESGGRTNAHNPNQSTGDNSYGLWQINMIDNLGRERRRSYGLKKDEDLWDPATNVRAAKKVHESQGLNAWTVYRTGAYRQYLPEAKRALARLRSSR